MTALARFAVRGLGASPLRTAVRVLVLAAATALLGAMLVFVGHSLRTMTAGAVRSVPLDWQGPVDSYARAVQLAGGVARQPGVLAAVPAATGPFAAAEHTSADGVIRSGSGAILAVPPSYFQHFPTVRFLSGSLQPGQVVLDQQLAATLRVGPGDTIRLIPRQGAPPRTFRVSGIAAVKAADHLFQPLDPLVGPAPAQPPANVAIMPLDAFAAKIAPAIGPGKAAVAPPGSVAGTQWQVQAQVDPTAIAGSPGAALPKADQIRNRVERSFPGEIRFVDNLSAALSAAAGDALYAETLFIMLALPGAIVALGLAYLAALGTATRDRRDLSLLRARGASRRDLLALSAIESALVGLLAGALGGGLSLFAVWLLARGSLDLSGDRLGITFGACIAVAFAGALAARIGAGLAAARGGVIESRRSVQRSTTPLWQRLWLDVIALVASGLVYWLTVRTGFSAVVNPDSNPTLSLSVYMFLAPALLWIGSALLLVRLRGRVFGWLTARAAGKRATSRRGFLLASASRRAREINRGLLLVGLLLAFGVELGLFTATYDAQARVDAQLTLGADVVVTAPPGVIGRNGLERKVARTTGVAAVTAVDHSYAYVGPDLQDTFGIDAANFNRATGLRNSYFIGGTADQTLQRLHRVPDGVVVSKETIVDYSLKVGDLLRLRVLDHRTGRFVVTPFHVVGIVIEFPSAPRDSFMVVNRDYLHEVTHDEGPGVLFVRTSDSPPVVARRIAEATASSGTSVANIRDQTAQTVSSITAVALGGVSRIEEVFAILLAAVGMGLFVAVGVAERRRELATMAALGASLRDITAFVWTEAAIVLGFGLALAALLGWLLAEMLVAMLQHVFDPPPDALTAPWPFLDGLAGAAIVGGAVAVALAARAIRRLPLGAILREE